MAHNTVLAPPRAEIFDNRLGYPRWYHDMVNGFGYDATQGGKRRSDVSATSMLKPLQVLILLERHGDQVREDIADQTWRFFGSAAHEASFRAQLRQFDRLKKAAALAGEPEPVIPWLERRMYAPLITPVGQIVVSGQADHIDVLSGDTRDLKFTSAWTAVYRSRDEEWARQLAIYQWFADWSGVEVSGKGTICAVFRDWDKKLAAENPDYPQHDVGFFDFKLASPRATGLWLQNRAAEIIEARKLSDAELPPCSSEDMWEKDEKWAVYKTRSQKRATKLFDKEDAAIAFVEALLEKNPDAYVEHRPGQRIRCASYCKIAPFCHQYRLYCKENGIPVPEMPKPEEAEAEPALFD